MGTQVAEDRNLFWAPAFITSPGKGGCFRFGGSVTFAAWGGRRRPAALKKEPPGRLPTSPLRDSPTLALWTPDHTGVR